MSHNTTSLVHCPQETCRGCGGETVEATYGPRTVTVQPCQSLIDQGWEGPQLVLWHNQALRLLTPASSPVWRHRDGLVTFG